MTRYTPLHPDSFTAAQDRVAQAIRSGPRGRVLAPHDILLRSPELADLAQQLGARLRYGTSLPPRLSELAILMVARWWSCAYEWDHHVPIALRAGLSPTVIGAMAEGRAPVFDAEDEGVLYGYGQAVLRDRTVSAPVFQATLALFGETALVELGALLGYYSMLAMLLNTFEVPGEGAAEIPLAPLT